MQLAFQERAGWIIVSLVQRGWLDAVSADQRDAFRLAVRGLFHLAGVDLVWEQVAARFGPNVNWYDITAEGLLLWRDGGHAAAELYRFRDTAATASWMPPPYRVTEVPPSTLDEVFFSRSRLTWDEWVRTWDGVTEDSPGALGAGLPTSPEAPTAGLPDS